MDVNSAWNSIKNYAQSATDILNNDILQLFRAKLDTTNITDISNLSRPAVTFRWIVEMPSALLPYGNKPGEKLGTLPNNYVTSCRLNLPVFNSVSADRIGRKILKNGTIDITFYEDEDYTTTKYIMKWSEVRFNRKTGYFRPLKAQIGKINVYGYGIANNDLKLGAVLYVLPSEQSIKLAFNGESQRQKIEVSFDLIYWDVITANSVSSDGKGGMKRTDYSIDDAISKIKSFF